MPAKVLVIDRQVFQCQIHQEVFSQGNKTMIEVWKMLNDEVKMLEIELVKLQTIYCFVNSEGIVDIIDSGVMKQVENIRHDILLEFDSIVEKTSELTKDATFKQFKFLWDGSKSIQSKKNEILDQLSPFFARIFEEKMFQNLTGKYEPKVETSKYEGEMSTIIHSSVDDDFTILFDSLFDKEIEFYTIFAETKNKLKTSLEGIIADQKLQPEKAKDPLYSSLNMSRMVYQTQMNKSRQEVVESYNRLKACHIKFNSIKERYPELKDEIDDFLKEMDDKPMKVNSNPLRSTLAHDKREGFGVVSNRFRTEVSDSGNKRFEVNKLSDTKNETEVQDQKAQNLMKLLQHNDIEEVKQINDDFILKLDKKEKVKSTLISELSQIELPKIKGFQLNYSMPSLNKFEVENLNTIFSKSIVQNIEYCYINLGEWVDYNYYSSGLNTLVAKVTGEFYLDKFKLKDKCLKNIFENGYKMK